MRILITAGPTREYIDDVRFLSNASTGRMGCSLARAALAAGHRVILVHGPIACEPPRCEKTIPVTSAADMLGAVTAHIAEADAAIMAAAVSDYRPAERIPGKIKKQHGEQTLRLEATPDIAATVGRNKAERVHIGFALEASDGRRNALAKLRAKNFDLIVLNSPAAIGAEMTHAELLFASGESETLLNVTKDQLAERIVTALDMLKGQKGTCDGAR